MYRSQRIAAILLCSVLGVAFAATKAPAARPRQPVISDGELERSIRARFATSKISTHHFQVHVQGGVATIEGQTDVLQHKGTATRLAKNMGAISVVNRVVVSEAAKEKARQNLESGRRRAQVKRTETTPRSEKRSE